MHKLGSTSIDCDDFSIPEGQMGIGIGSSPIMKVLYNLQKAKAKQRLN